MKRLYVSITLVLLALPSRGIAQRQDSVHILREEWFSLSRIFWTLDGGDTMYTRFFPGWLVHDRWMKLRIYNAFRNRGILFNETDPVSVIAMPDQQDIADIKIGKVSFGRMYAKFTLSRDLYQAILARKYEHEIQTPAGYATE